MLETKNFTMGMRQVHLDFHTSPLIPSIGQDFDPQQFAAVAKAAHVDSITVFARCHHGYVYYPSKINGSRPEIGTYTHIEVESLPTSAWGYNHYPLLPPITRPSASRCWG